MVSSTIGSTSRVPGQLADQSGTEDSASSRVDRDSAAGPQRRRLAPEERKAQVLDVAAELFCTHGTNFTSSQLAAAAGVSEGTVFRYFPDMDSLIRAARREAIGLSSLLPRIAAAEDLPEIRDRLSVAGMAIASRIAETARLVQASGETRGRPQKEEIREVVDALTRLFQGFAPGNVSERQLAAMFMGLLVSGTLFGAHSSPPQGTSDISGAAVSPVDVDDIVELFLSGLNKWDPR